MFILCLAFLGISSDFFFFLPILKFMWGFTEQPSTLQNNQLIQSRSEWGGKNLPR